MCGPPLSGSPPSPRPLVDVRVGSELSLVSHCAGDLGPEPEDAEAETKFVVTGLPRENTETNRKSSEEEEELSRLIRMQSKTGSELPQRTQGSLGAPRELGAGSPRPCVSPSPQGWLASLVSAVSPGGRQPHHAPSPEHGLEHSPASVYSMSSSTSGGSLPAARSLRCVRELAGLLRSPKVTRVVVLLGAGASQESKLETYVNMEHQFFSLANGRLTVHPTKPAGVPSFMYAQLFGPLHTWQDLDELANGVSRERFMAYKHVSDAFCTDMVEKFSKAEPHQGYQDLSEVLAAWKADLLEPLTSLCSASGAASLKESNKQAQIQPSSNEKQIAVATTNLDKLAVKAFGGVAAVHEMHGDIDFVRAHRIPLRGSHARSPTKRPYGKVSGTPLERIEEGFVHKPLVMHFEEDYYRTVHCRRALAVGDLRDEAEQTETESFTFRHMKPELSEFVKGNAEGTVVLEIGCSNRVRAVPALRESMLKRGATVFVVNLTEKSSHLKQRMLASQPMLVSKLSNLRVVPSTFGDFASMLRWELLDPEVQQ